MWGLPGGKAEPGRTEMATLLSQRVQEGTLDQTVPKLLIIKLIFSNVYVYQTTMVYTLNIILSIIPNETGKIHISGT